MGNWHIYHCPDEGQATRLEDITTPAQARKNPQHYPSVTSVLGMLPNPFMSKWRGRKMVELSKEYPALDAEELESLAWGTRQHPVTGEAMTSAEFGTAAHACIELFFEDEMLATCDPFWNEVEATVEYLTENFCVMAAEVILVDHDLRIAGTVDYMGKDSDGRWMLADFKFREKPNTYDKDLAQLAVEARMLRKDLGLDYDPAIISIPVVNGEPHPKKWSAKMQAKGLQIAEAAAHLYWSLPGYGWKG